MPATEQDCAIEQDAWLEVVHMRETAVKFQFALVGAEVEYRIDGHSLHGLVDFVPEPGH